MALLQRHDGHPGRGLPGRPLLSRNLRLLQAAQFVSLVGDGLYVSVLLNYALRVSGGDARAAGWVAVAEHLPYLVLGVWAGVLVDRWDRRRVLLGADLLRAAVLLGLWAADRAGWVQGAGAVAGAAALLTVGALFFNPARDALLPELAEGAELVRANAAVAVSQQLAMLVGPLAASVLLASRPLPEAFLWDGLSFLGSFALVWAIRVRPRPPGGGAAVDVAGALRYAASRGDLKALLLLTMLNNLWIMGPALVGSVALVNRICGPEAGPARYGIYLAAFFAGMVLGTVLLPRLAGVARWKLLVAGIFLDGATFLPFESVSGFPWLLAAIFAHALVVPLITVVRPAALQAHVPPERLGQVFALVNLAVFGSTALSAAAAGALLGAGMEPARLFTLAGIGGMLSGGIALALPPLRRLV